MSQVLLQSLAERLDGLHQQYNLHFAGQMRATRDPQMIALLIEAAVAIEREARRIQANGDAALRQEVLDRAAERKTLYGNEAKAIAQAVADMGPEGVEAAIAGRRANSVFHRYARHFAGRSRSTRDLGLLQEIIDDLRSIKAHLEALKAQRQLTQATADVQVIEGQLTLFEAELGHIRDARDAGTLDERAGTLAQIANGQFALYETNFAGQSRVSRRPELLQRAIAQLEAVLARMEGLQEIGLHDEGNRGNIGLVRGRLQAWQSELTAIREVRQETSILAMTEALGEAADKILGAYNEHFAGQDRATRSLELLGGLCDQMGEVERQMYAIGGVQRLTVNERNLAMARDLLHMLEDEWSSIQSLRQG